MGLEDQHETATCPACVALRRAAIDVGGTHGLAAVTPAAVAALAGMTQDAAAEHGATDAIGLIAAAYGESLDWLQVVCGTAYGQGPWGPGMRRGTLALVAALTADPVRARFCYLEVPSGCRALVAARDRDRLGWMHEFLAAVEAFGPAPHPPASHVEFIFGALRHAIESHLRADDLDRLPAVALGILDVLDPLPPATEREPALT